MRKLITLALGATALALPGVDAFASASAQTTLPKKKIVVATRTFNGAVAQADRWGDLQVRIVVRKTTTTVIKTKKKTVTRKLISVKVPVSPDHTDRSIFINEQALPTLIQEALQLQSSGVDMVSGATNSSDAFQSSLQSAILQAKAW